MHIHSLKITNFKGFAEEKNYLPFNTPNGEKGSGLNILLEKITAENQLY